MAMYRGNFDISDYLVERAPLAFVSIEGALLHFRRDAGGPVWLTLELQGDDAAATLHVRYAEPRLNRFWFRICAEPEEHVWGCGEQMSYFDLRGRRFPLWTSEPGVGRDKTSPITFQADVQRPRRRRLLHDELSAADFPLVATLCRASGNHGL